MEELENVESAPVQESESNSGTTETPVDPQSPEAANQAIFDLDKAEKFRFDNREWTAKELRDSVLRHTDYSQKTQALAKERKYYDNLSHDLEAIKRDPGLAEKFKAIYPEKFHAYLGYVMSQQPTNQAQPNVQQQTNPEFSKYLNRLEQVEGKFREQEVTAINAELDAKFSEFSKKYPMADEESVVSRAQILLDQGHKIDDKAWDQIWKTVHDKYEKLADQRYSEKVKKQTAANQSGKDVASGGGTPGRAPLKPKSIKEATNAFFDSGAVDTL